MKEIKMILPDPPEGYAYTGEYRAVKDGEFAADDEGNLIRGSTEAAWPILRTIKPKRWRALHGDGYYYVGTTSAILRGVDVYDSYSDSLHAAGNYFRTKAEAKAFQYKIRKILQDD